MQGQADRGRRPAPTTPLRSVAGVQRSPESLLPPRPRKWPPDSAGRGAQGSAAGNAPGWRKRAQEARLAAAGAVYPAAVPAPNISLSARESAGAAYLTSLPALRAHFPSKQARAVVEGKAITPLYKKTKQKSTSAAWPSFFPEVPAAGLGLI